jgi:hypothetical protein
MTRADEMAEQLMGSILSRLTSEANQTIFKGNKPPKNPVRRAEWTKEAMRNLDENVDEVTREEIMHGLGVNCANHNVSVVKAALKRRGKHETLDAFIDAEIRKPQVGTSLERDGESLILSYLPRQFSHPMRCYCGLVNKLPESENISPTYCQCSVAFVETWWSAVVGEPVEVQLLESAITGSDRCRFRITW